MAKPLRITGVVGQIRWAYYTAAGLRGFTVSRAGSAWTLHGAVVASDAFKLTQRPLVFVAPIQGGEWQWPIVALSIVKGEVRATLGPPLDTPGPNPQGGHVGIT